MLEQPWFIRISQSKGVQVYSTRPVIVSSQGDIDIEGKEGVVVKADDSITMQVVDSNIHMDAHEIKHGNSTQGKMGVEVGFSKEDFNIAAGIEVERGKLKSSSEDLQAEPSEAKAYTKIEAEKKSLKISRGIITGDIEAEIESGEYKAKYGSERKK